MPHSMTPLAYVVVAALGGFIADRMRIPGGAMIGAMLAVIVLKHVSAIDWSVSRPWTFTVQIGLGLVVGSTYHPGMLKTFHQLLLPIAASTVALVVTGILIALVFRHLGMLDMKTAFLGTSPGAMSVISILAIDSHLDAPLVSCFHFFRLLFVMLTAPLIFKFLS